MPTRRQTALGLGSMALGSAVVSSASFFSGTAAAADLRIVVTSELTLTPGRTGEEYVGTDEDGEVNEIVIEKLNQRSISRFEDLVEVTNNGDVPYDRLAFSFAGTGEDPDAQSVDVAETLRVVSADESTETDEQGRTTILADSSETFESGDAVTFGMVVNLIPGDPPGALEELPEESSVTLGIAAVNE
ncbi:hypothetical protein EXE46_14690 [Halorubrum sp. GN11_10-6_MGM]|uniref:hypothetical protein n=1 Tax=Halorubrum sp. GN11_10-6_MGM TaxID=2518112 RepID=UPI0010F95333|nr:hypothetical protein [Halorubrum sp. GN11_10-6_MGM]TKX73134.1 hypothetical protein EXE46_14690 [Halorubrum sp. GN11_10-6_MGM]